MRGGVKVGGVKVDGVKVDGVKVDGVKVGGIKVGGVKIHPAVLEQFRKTKKNRRINLRNTKVRPRSTTSKKPSVLKVVKVPTLKDVIKSVIKSEDSDDFIKGTIRLIYKLLRFTEQRNITNKNVKYKRVINDIITKLTIDLQEILSKEQFSNIENGNGTNSENANAVYNDTYNHLRKLSEKLKEILDSDDEYKVEIVESITDTLNYIIKTYLEKKPNTEVDELADLLASKL